MTDQSRKKIIFMDLDDTLLTTERTVSEGNKKAVHEALDAGHYAVIATGRAVPSVAHIVEMLDFKGPGCFIAAYNGAHIYDCQKEKIIAEFPFPAEYARYLYREAQRWSIHIHTYSEDCVVTEHICPELLFYTDRAKTIYRLEDRETSFQRTLPKVLLVHSSHAYLRMFQETHQEWAKERVNHFFSDPVMLEYCSVDASKGKALQFLCRYLHLPIENSIAIGDEQNDISMIRAAHIGIAMQNATDEVKQAADAVTLADHDHDGVAESIRKYMLQE